MIHNQEIKSSTEAGHMLRLEGKEFKIIIVNMLRNLVAASGPLTKMENFNQQMETLKKETFLYYVILYHLHLAVRRCVLK